MIKRFSYISILFALLVFPYASYASEGHDHTGHGSGGTELKQEMDEHVGDREKTVAQDKPQGYIRTLSPAGYNVVLGRKNPLPELFPEMVKDSEGNTIKVYKLRVENVTFEMYPGKYIEGWGFNRSIPGPTIRVTEGDRIRIILENKTDTAHTIHVHGQKKPVEMDGIPYLGQKPVEKNQVYTYEFVVTNPGTHWYHCHVDSAHHVDMGMYGAFIVAPKDEDLQYDREYIMMLDEWPTGHIHIHEAGAPMSDHREHGVVTEHPGVPRHEEHAKKPAKRDWYPETHTPYQPVYDGFTINGRAFPFTEPVTVKKGERIKIRFINTGYKSHFMHTHSHKFVVVERSGSRVNEPQKIDTVEIGAGQRVDIILFADNPGIWPFHCHRLDHVTNEHIYPGGMMTFIVYED